MPLHEFLVKERPAGVVVAVAIALTAMVPHGDAFAGVTNPDISVIGQPSLRVTNTPGDPDAEHPRISAGETEIVFDAALNPYARGLFVLALGDEGMELEEGYFNLTRGLPAGLALKGGKYRVPFGRMNTIHPHALPFAEPLRLLATLLPGEESFNEAGVSLSDLVALPGDRSLLASIDLLQGDSFRAGEGEGAPDDERAAESRPAYAARVEAFQMLGERSGLEVGVSAAGGTTHVSAGARSRLIGADFKAKIWSSPASNLVVQGEWIRLDRDTVLPADDGGIRLETRDAAGFYLLADYQVGRRFDGGVAYERYEVPGASGDSQASDAPVDAGFTAFAGYALLEESLSFRADWYRAIPEEGDASDTFTLRAIISMGPHKPHPF